MGQILNRRRAMGVMCGKSLPYDAEIEYLQSTGTQYIDTEVQCDSNVILVVVGRFTENVDADFGYYQANTTQRYHFGIYNNKFIFGVGNAYTNNVSFNTSTHVFVLNGNGTAKLDNTQYSLQTYNNSYKGNIFLFARNDAGVVNSTKTKFVLNSATIIANGVTVRDYIPVRVGTTGYLYDKISGRLFGNIGADNFIVGPDTEYASYVWVSLSMLKGSPINRGNNSYIPQWNDIPIHGVAVTTINTSLNSCRAGFSPNPKQSYDTSNAAVPSRIWLSGNIDNKISYTASSAGWMTYSQAGWTSGIINTTSQTTYVYYNNEASKISSYDVTGPGLLYFYTYQSNFPIDCFYVLITKDDLNRILGL